MTKTTLSLTTAICSALLLTPLGHVALAQDAGETAPEDQVDGTPSDGGTPEDAQDVVIEDNGGQEGDPIFEDGAETEIDESTGLPTDITSGNIDDWNGPCFQRDATGHCIDDAGLPISGHFTDLDHFGGRSPSQAYVVPSDSNAYQQHGNVLVTEQATIWAHDVCRIVKNNQRGGAALFIGLGTSSNGYKEKNADTKGRKQWISFIQNHPANVAVSPCCVPVTVSACGKQMKITNYQAVGYAKNFTLNNASWGYRLTLTCQNGNAGIGDTSPILAGESKGIMGETAYAEPGTSWKVTQSGSCSKPVVTCTTRYTHGRNDKPIRTCTTSTNNGNASGGSSGAGNGHDGSSNQSHDTNGDGATDSPGSGTSGQVTKDGPIEKGLGGGGGTGGGGSSRVICTYFKDKGLMPVSWWEADLKFTWRFIPDDTVRGYHVWAVPAVEAMRAGGLAGRSLERVLLPLALWRAEEIASRMKVPGAKGNFKGKLVRLAGEPACTIIGVVARSLGFRSDWRRLYRTA